MVYDGVVIRINKILYLFLLNPDDNKIMDGINISDHDCYKDMKDDQIMTVNVIFRDGTQEVEEIDLYEYIHGDSYGIHNIFIHIHDIMLFSINKNGKNVSLKKLIEKGDLVTIAMECIEISKKEKEKDV